MFVTARNILVTALMAGLMGAAMVHGFAPTTITTSQQKMDAAAMTAITFASSSSSSLSRRRKFSARRFATTATTKTTTTTALASVARMSEECLEASKRGMDVAHALGLKELTNEALLAGIIAHPERARSTLDRYDITRQVVDDVVLQDAVMTFDPDRESLPFGSQAKITLSKACQIADDQESEIVRSEHVLLALLGYNGERQPLRRVPVGDTLKQIPAIRERGSFSVTDFCNELVQSLPLIAPDSPTSTNRVVVTRGVAGEPNGGILAQVGVDWTQQALEGRLDPVFGRNDEIRACLRTLGRRRKNNPCLIGDPGTGKTAVAEGVAQVLAQGLAQIQDAQAAKSPISRLGKGLNFAMKPFNREEDGSGDSSQDNDDDNVDLNGQDADNNSVLPELPPCPPALMGTRLINVELSALVAGTGARGSLEERLKDLIKEATEQNVILFIDELHNLVGTGGGGGGDAMNAANLMKPALARGELRVLGATTTPEYRQYIQADGALERRFQPLEVKEPTVFETLDILAAVSPKYEDFHGVTYTYDALVAAAKLSDRYLNDRFLPDKAVDLMDEAGSRVKMVEDDQMAARGSHPYEVTPEDIANVISDLTGIPVGKLDLGERQRLKNLEADLGKRIKGQAPAVKAVSKAIRRARAGMRDGRRPVASLLFCGSTGVGKTELCKALAAIYYGKEKDMIRIDMSEYMDRFSTSRLIGAPPGYVGYNEGGQLTEAVRRAPHSLILFDEVEKAHEDVLNILLQVMDDGQLTDGKGRTVSFRNNIFVMTSNLGSRELLEAAKGDDGTGSIEDMTVSTVTKALEEAMRPEFLNRIDEIVVFRPLEYENLKDIAANLVEATVERTANDQNIQLEVSDNIAEIVTREAMAVASSYGARPIRRAVQRYLDDTLADAIMDGFIDEGDSVNVNLDDPNGNSGVVRITRKLDGETMLIDVDAPGEIQEDAWSAAAYGDLPDLGGPPKKDPGSFQ